MNRAKLSKRQIAKGIYDAMTICMKEGPPFSVVFYLADRLASELTGCGHGKRGLKENRIVDSYSRRYLWQRPKERTD